MNPLQLQSAVAFETCVKGNGTAAEIHACLEQVRLDQQAIRHLRNLIIEADMIVQQIARHGVHEDDLSAATLLVIRLQQLRYVIGNRGRGLKA